MTNKINNSQLIDDKLYFYARDLGQKWKSSQPTFTNDELLEIFPETKEIILEKIAHYQLERNQVIEKMKSFRQKVKAANTPKKEFFDYFWGYQCLKYLIAPQVVEIDKHLGRLKLQAKLFKPHSKKDNFQKASWSELVEKAKNISLLEIAEPLLGKVRTYGNRVTALCPFHKEKTPSFNIYTNKNSFYCFGCSLHGDVIEFVMKKENLSFKDAIKKLTI